METIHPNEAYLHNKNSKSPEWNIVVNEILTEAQDNFSRSVWVIEVEHKRIHQWQAFRISLLTNLVAQWSIYCQFKTWDRIVHLKEKTLVDGTNNIICRFYEDPVGLDRHQCRS